MFKTGVVIGKFYPPHRGHKFLIETARSQSERLTVIVCARDDQTIPGPLRLAWLQEIHPDVSMILVEDHYPDDDSQLWADLTLRWLGYAPEAVFTSEDYGDAYARLMGAQHVLVDKSRNTVPCSGRQIREAPLLWWDYIEPCVRAYYARRICIVGAESTGKTTLAMALAKHYDTPWVPEYGREFWEEKVRGPEPTVWYSNEFTHIAEEQSRREDAAARQANRLLICDTDPLTTGFWHERYLGTRSPEVEAIASTRCYALYILTDVNTPYEQDGTRDSEQWRHWMHERFVAELQGQGRPYISVTGSPEERLAAAIEAIDERMLG